MDVRVQIIKDLIKKAVDDFATGLETTIVLAATVEGPLGALSVSLNVAAAAVDVAAMMWRKSDDVASVAAGEDDRLAVALMLIERLNETSVQDPATQRAAIHRVQRHFLSITGREMMVPRQVARSLSR
jgi:hypothetical protein